MKAAVLTGLRKMEIRDVPDPVLRHAGDVRVRVEAVGVCGSDVHYYVNGKIGSQVVEYPFRVGHEFAGTVTDVGRDVKDLRPGMRVAVDPAMPCGMCDQCRIGRPHTCRNLKFLGCPKQAEGCLCESVVMPAHCCFPLPAGVSAEMGALVEPLSIGVYAARFAAPLNTSAIGILGAGPIGLSVLIAAAAEGCRAAYVTDRIDARVAAARRTGASWAGNPDREDVVERIAGLEPLLLDAVFECCGQQEAVDQAVHLLKPGGKLVLVGIPTVDRISLLIDVARRKEIVLQNVRRQNGCVEDALALVREGRVPGHDLMTHRFPLARTQEAFDLVENYRDGVIKAMIRLDE